MGDDEKKALPEEGSWDWQDMMFAKWAKLGIVKGHPLYKTNMKLMEQTVSRYEKAQKALNKKVPKFDFYPDEEPDWGPEEFEDLAAARASLAEKFDGTGAWVQAKSAHTVLSSGEVANKNVPKHDKDGDLSVMIVNHDDGSFSFFQGKLNAGFLAKAGSTSGAAASLPDKAEPKVTGADKSEAGAGGKRKGKDSDAKKDKKGAKSGEDGGALHPRVTIHSTIHPTIHLAIHLTIHFLRDPPHDTPRDTPHVHNIQRYTT